MKPVLPLGAIASTHAPMPATGLRARWNGAAAKLTRLVPDDLLALASRMAIAGIFLLSGRTKVEGLLTVTDSAYELFRTEYKLPLVPPELAAHLAAYAEHLPDVYVGDAFNCWVGFGSACGAFPPNPRPPTPKYHAFLSLIRTHRPP